MKRGDPPGSWKRSREKGSVFRKIHKGHSFCRLRGICPDGSKMIVRSPTVKGLLYVLCGSKAPCNQQSIYQKTIDLRERKKKR